MKILYINKIETNAGWGFETFLHESLIKINIETICLDYQKNAYALSKALLEIDENFDAVLLERGCGYLIPLSVLKSIQRPKFLLFTELVSRNVNQHYLLKSGIFEHVFFRSLPCMQWVADRGWLAHSQMSLFQSAIDPEFHRTILDIKKDINILFVGTLLPRRKKIIDDLQKEFAIVTSNAFGVDMVNIINRAKIILNIHGENFLDTETRVYETLACQGFLLTEKLSSESPFINNLHLVEAEDLDDLKNHIRYYLKHSLERDRIARLGYEEVIAFHTFGHRAEQIRQVIERCNIPLFDSKDPLKRSTLQYVRHYELYGKIRDITLETLWKYLSIIKRILFYKIKLINKKAGD
ncbi:glycosyltransferase [Pseudanabaena sp. UWO310]|uniref:glycosyltransferase family protein n=1 Tax=Pseudanabaena sp. UWO310 TaxID=2480795 RepID=UPI0016806D2A|nr:glycosyltransferase [Pseudanabaena sp. UWO310]